tara:strand:- start:834 stop:1067 length:234 start_codon:yes stop_codon:yes gene_type:complete
MDYLVQLNDDENTIEMKNNISNTIKELENLYSWSQFYQVRKQRTNVKITQDQIRDKKQDLVELKNEFNNSKRKKKKK